VLAAVIEEVKEKNADITPEASEMIGIAAIKLVILRAMAGRDINFDPETSLSFEGDSGPYIQYTAVRAMSLIQKGAAAGISPHMQKPIAGTELLERMIARFPDIVTRAQTEWAPHYLVTYLLELAQAFNSYYGQHKVVDEDTEASAYRLGITHTLHTTLVKGLDMLGIAVPEKM
jgi:arginyl-tRNA synthetase